MAQSHLTKVKPFGQAIVRKEETYYNTRNDIEYIEENSRPTMNSMTLATN